MFNHPWTASAKQIRTIRALFPDTNNRPSQSLDGRPVTFEPPGLVTGSL